MSSILTNNSAMNALSTLRNINQGLDSTQDRISTGLKISSGKDNAAYFSISETMKGDSNMYKAIDESLTMTKNAVSTGRLGAEKMVDLANQFVERVAFAQSDAVDRDKVQEELDELVKQMETTIQQSTFNGKSFVDGTSNADADTDSTRYNNATDPSDQGSAGYDADADPDIESVVTGITRGASGITTTSIGVQKVDLTSIKDAFSRITVNADLADGADLIKGVTPFVDGTDDDLSHMLEVAETALGMAIDDATTLGVAEKAIGTQQDFLKSLTENIDSGVGAMVDANMEEEAARLQALQVQQQLATQSLSMANQKPQNILSLFR